jgi:hypothetical protein
MTYGAVTSSFRWSGNEVPSAVSCDTKIGLFWVWSLFEDELDKSIFFRDSYVHIGG